MATLIRPADHGRMAPNPAAGRVAARLAGIVALAALACSLPGRPVVVLPAIDGRIASEGVWPSSLLRLVLIHRDSPALHARHERPLEADGSFAFEPTLLDVAGRELGRHYRVHLHLRTDGVDRVIWRADVDRTALGPPVRLVCDLARPIGEGQPCRVEDPEDQPWLLADGRRHFERLCSDCHRPSTFGGDRSVPTPGPVPDEAPADPPNAGAAPDLSRIAARHGGRFDRDAVAARIEGRNLAPSHRRGEMPVWGERLSAEFEAYVEGDDLIGATLDPIVAYLESLQRSD